jgi:hypothetical protein
VSVWSPTPPCALFTRLPSPRLKLCSAPRSLRLASSDQSTYTVPFCASPPALTSSHVPGLRRLPVGATALSFVTVK